MSETLRWLYIPYGLGHYLWKFVVDILWRLWQYVLLGVFETLDYFIPRPWIIRLHVILS